MQVAEFSSCQMSMILNLGCIGWANASLSGSYLLAGKLLFSEPIYFLVEVKEKVRSVRDKQPVFNFDALHVKTSITKLAAVKDIPETRTQSCARSESLD